MIYDCIVIGGGASGMMAAIVAARRNFNVMIIEHSSRLGRKLLQTGNGKCNFTNLDMTKEMYQNEDIDFVMDVISKFDEKNTIEFFKSIGIFSKNKNGYMYPHSETAASLQEAMILELQRLKVEIIFEKDIKTIEKRGDVFVLDNSIKGYNVLLATGSKASPVTGSDGSGYELAKIFGHKIVKPLPALVQLVCDSKICKSIAGVRSTGNIKLYVNDEYIAQDTGEIQYTDYGISGIPVFQISRYAVKAVDSKKDVYVVIDFLPDISDDLLRKYIDDNQYLYGDKTIEQFFGGMLNKKLVYAVAKNIGLNSDICAKEISAKDIKKLVNSFKKYRFIIKDFKSFDKAQVCQGGVSLREIDKHTMQSKKVEGLFFAGEIADVDGKCGGYNLQWAWSSAYLAAISMKIS